MVAGAAIWRRLRVLRSSLCPLHFTITQNYLYNSDLRRANLYR
jgi:hypothetical protein